MENQRAEKLGDEVFKLLRKLNRLAGKSDLHSFQAKIKNGVVWVDCRGYEVFMTTFIYDKEGKETRSQWSGNVIASASRLEQLGLDIQSVEI